MTSCANPTNARIEKYEAVVQFRNGVVKGYKTFDELHSIEENVSMVCADRISPLTLDEFFELRQSRRGESILRERCYDILEPLEMRRK